MNVHVHTLQASRVCLLALSKMQNACLFICCHKGKHFIRGQTIRLMNSCCLPLPMHVQSTHTSSDTHPPHTHLTLTHACSKYPHILRHTSSSHTSSPPHTHSLFDFVSVPAGCDIWQLLPDRVGGDQRASSPGCTRALRGFGRAAD